MSASFACRDGGNGVTRIVYTAQEHENGGAVARFMSDCRSDSVGRDTTTRSLGVGPQESRVPITSQRQRRGRFVPRLIELDRELYERYADVGVRGEPSRHVIQVAVYFKGGLHK